jgi:hypothetical protein
MLYHNDRVSLVNKRIERCQQLFDIVKMQTGRRFVEDK